MAILRVGGLQFDMAWEDPAANFKRLRAWVDSAAAHNVDVLLLPELFATGFSMRTEHIAEAEDGPSTRFLREQAERTGIWLGASVPLRSSAHDRPHNTFVLAGPAGEQHRYQKIHPFTFAREHEHYTAGDSFTTVVVGGLRLSLFVCYDLRFGDEMWALAEHTDAYLFVANWPETRRQHWMTLLRARAIENQAYVVGVNRVGDDPRLHYTGDSRIIDPNGEILAAASGQEALLVADLDSEVVTSARRQLPFLRDRRAL